MGNLKDLFTNNHKQSVYIRAERKEEDIDIQGYRTLCSVTFSSEGKAKINEILNQAVWKTDSEEVYISDSDKIKIVDKIKNYMLYKDDKEDINKYFQYNNEIILDDGRKLILITFEVDYYEATEEMEHCYMYGYLLKR